MPASREIVRTVENAIPERRLGYGTKAGYRLRRRQSLYFRVVGVGCMAENAVNVIAIELIAAAQGCDFHQPLRSSAPLERVRARLRERVLRLENDRYLAPDIAAAADLVRSGALAAAADADLPGFEGASACNRRRPSR